MIKARRQTVRQRLLKSLVVEHSRNRQTSQ